MVFWDLAMPIFVKYYQHFGETSCLIFYFSPEFPSFIHLFHLLLFLSLLTTFSPSSFHPSCLFVFSYFLPLLYPVSPFFFLTPPFDSWKLHAFAKARTHSCQTYGNLCNINSQRQFILLSTECKIRIECVPLLIYRLYFNRCHVDQPNTLCVTVDIDSAGCFHGICGRSGILVASDEEVCIKVA
jgi:hypothetical protein